MNLLKPLQLSLALSSVLAITAASPAIAQSVDIQPTQPDNPQIQLYPGAGGEVFWQRSTDDRGVIGYEITRNGIDLGIRDVLSVYDPSLVPDTPYTFTIAAVDTAGQRSAVATVSIGGDTVTSSGDPAIAPTNLSLQVYSSTAAELFWQPSTFIDRNEIRRDGVLITTRSGGATRSFYDDTREPGRTYTYEVTAFNGGGQGSATIGGNDTPPTTDGEIQTGIGGDFLVQLAVYDAQSFELSWDRIAGAASYRLQRDGQTVQESDGISRYVAGIDTSATFNYTLAALDASGNVVLSTDFTVAPSGTPQLVATDSTTHGSDALEPVEASLEIVQDKTFRISWQQSEDAEVYRVFENPDGISGFTDISGDLDAMTTTYDHRVALYARVNAQYFVQSCNDDGCVDSALVVVSGTLDSAVGYIKASNPMGRDEFGRSVSLSADGTTMAVAAAGQTSSAPLSGRMIGQVYVFVRNGEIWQQQAVLDASNLEDRPDGDSDLFGFDVSLSADGNTVAVGAFREDSVATGIDGNQDDNSTRNSGAVYVFVRNGEIWRQQAYVKASNTDRNDHFGSEVSLNADGNTLAVVAANESSAATGINGDQSDNSASAAGAVYVFVRDGETWRQQAYIKASTSDASDFFGDDISLSADGNTLAVGASGEDGEATGINGNQNDNSSLNSGAAYLFVRDGENWQQQAYIKASNNGRNDRFAEVISLSGDGNTLAVGTTQEDSSASGINGDENSNAAGRSGATYVFVRNGEIWQQQAYVKGSNTGTGDLFGTDVSLSADGNTLAVGASGESSAAAGINGNQNDDSVTSSGAAYVFVRNQETWQQQAYIKASNTGDRFARFGAYISLSADGNTLAAGALWENSGATGINGDQNDTSAPTASGAVYLY